MASGHPDAIHYTLGQLYDEANLVIERDNNRIVTEAQLAQMGVAGILSAKSRAAFTKQIKSLNVVSKPRRGLFEPED